MESQPRPTPERIKELKQAAASGEIAQGAGSLSIAQERADQTIEERNLREQLERSRAHGEAVVDYAKRSQEAEQARVEAAIENRRNKGDVRRLNDLAELEVFGSKGRTYRHPVTGEVIANKDQPYKGLLERMREEPAELQHRPPAYRDAEAKKRDAKAQKYEKELMRLVEEEGLELCQAKLIMDLRHKDSITKPRLRKTLEEDGVEVHDKDGLPISPEWKANEVYKNLDRKRIKKIKSEGVFTINDYETVMKGGSPYDEQPDTPATPDGEPEPPSETPPEEEQPAEPAQGQEQPSEKDEDVTPEKAEEKRKRELEAVSNLLADLEREAKPGAVPARVLKPVKGLRSKLKKGLIKHPRLLNVRQPNLALKDNLRRSVKGHVETGQTEGWVIPVYKKGGVPDPEYFYDHVENEDLAPWSDHLVITPNGRIYYSFVRADEVFGEEAKPGEYALTEDFAKGLNELSLRELQTVKKYLSYHLGSVEQETEVRPVNEREGGGEGNDALDEEAQLREHLAEEQARTEEARQRMQEQETEALDLPFLQAGNRVKVAAESGEVEDDWQIAGDPQEQSGRTMLPVQKIGSTEVKMISVEELARLNAQ